MKRFTSFGGFIESPEKDGMFVLASDCEKAMAKAYQNGVIDGDGYSESALERGLKYAKNVMEATDDQG